MSHMREETERLQVRVHGDRSLPVLVYLPGLHGDWTLIGGFRKAVCGQLCFAEITYPRTLTWTLEDYAAGVEAGLREQNLSRGWLLGESFGSQVVWPLVARGNFEVQGVILAGGFARHPVRWWVRLGERICGGLPLTWLTRVLFGYAKVARIRFRRNPENLVAINDFIARRTELDRQAATHRLRLIAQNDPCAIVRNTNVPVYAISGLVDPVVPWIPVRKWLKSNCESLAGYRVITRADHNVLSTGHTL